MFCWPTQNLFVNRKLRNASLYRKNQKIAAKLLESHDDKVIQIESAD